MPGDPKTPPSQSSPVSPARRAKVDAARQAWVRQLVDMSRRNNLLYFRDLKVGTLELTHAPAAAMQELLQSGRSERGVALTDLVPADARTQAEDPTLATKQSDGENDVGSWVGVGELRAVWGPFFNEDYTRLGRALKKSNVPQRPGSSSRRLEVRAREFLDWLKTQKGQRAKVDFAGDLPEEVYDRAVQEMAERERRAEEIKSQNLKRKTCK